MAPRTALPNLAIPPDLEETIMDLLVWRFDVLKPGAGDDRVESTTPPDLSSRVTTTVPFVRVSDIGAGGGRNRLTRERGHLDVDIFGRTRSQAYTLGREIQAFLEGYPHSITLDDGRFVLVEEVVTLMRPQRVAWDDSTLRRYYSSYQISARR